MLAVYRVENKENVLEKSLCILVLLREEEQQNNDRNKSAEARNVEYIIYARALYPHVRIQTEIHVHILTHSTHVHSHTHTHTQIVANYILLYVCI